MRIRYLPNFILDAWRVSGVTITLEFKDQNGKLHPTSGTKTIVFSNVNALLNNTFIDLECSADGDFRPLVATARRL